MAFIPDQRNNTGQFIATTAVFDVGRLYQVEVDSPEFKELIVSLYQQVNNISLSLNTKEFGYYLEEELVDSALYFNPASSSQLDLRPEFRLTIDTGPLPAGVTLIPHGLTILASWKFTDIYGAATDNIGFNYLPLPYADVSLGGNIELRVDAVNVIINNASGIAFTSGIVVLEYLKF